MENILSILIWLPIVGIAAIGFIPRDKEDLIKIAASITTGHVGRSSKRICCHKIFPLHPFRFCADVSWHPWIVLYLW